jgi:hypothetical protein
MVFFFVSAVRWSRVFFWKKGVERDQTMAAYCDLHASVREAGRVAGSCSSIEG